ncbi:MAG TPA: hypothetical protein VM536_20055 [Chloroflexia bacterium]|nr:hypothetical protein [Chloroflexia bacterium]
MTVVILLAGVLGAYQFPIHLGYHHQVEVHTGVLYLRAVLRPALTATPAGLRILLA